jgi:hypothetical protein
MLRPLILWNAGKSVDKAVLGRPDYGYEDTVMGKPVYWGPLLTENIY